MIGDWQGTSFELSAKDQATAASFCLARRYSNPTNGATVSVLLLGGVPAKISVHTPDVCYSGAGYTLNSESVFLHNGPDNRGANPNGPRKA